MHSDLAGTMIRPARPDDAPAIAALVRRAYAKWVPVIGREPLPMRADYHAALRRHRFDLLLSGAALLGLIETALRPDHLWIENLAVAPEAQGCGHGRLLLGHAEGLAAMAGVGRLSLLTNGAFADNLRFYRGHGYVVDREEEFMGGTTVYLSKVRVPA